MKFRRSKVRKLGELMGGAGLLGIMFGGMALDGPDYLIGLMLIGMAGLVFALGSWLEEISSSRKKPSRPTQVPPVHDRARQDAMFQDWLKYGTLK